MARAFLKVFFDFEERTEKLSETERGRLLVGMLHYAKTGEEPELTGNEQFIWPVFKGEIDKEIQSYEIKVANGSKGGRPPKEPEESENNRNKPNKTENNRNAQEQEQEYEQEQEQEEERTDDDDDSRARAREAAVKNTFKVSVGRTGTPEEVSSLCGTASIYGFGPEVTAEALRIAAGKGARSPVSYAKKILMEWEENGVRTWPEACAYQVKKEAATGRNDTLAAVIM